ncbi:efflux RND transporter periplasmic adaptor subunit [Arachidicoccus soli]|uniref:Efflux RND transporter periplasmic adaptor subunit n=1 Tax=Arachidicoccus soli TaxID=2341117 RepID=A0A386HPH7_9BACT|nr:efflux RND transporter periplasmic adaptor subunit [Arachidicoccus soli]AYD47486.1 efflux RND transporter periplasmic adaptor subunit [Arachidicoccus soli]
MRKYILILNMITLIASCTSKKPASVKEETHTEEASSNFVSLTQLQMKAAGIELGSIEQKNLQNSIKANGMLSVPNQNKAFVTSVNSGVIKTLLIQPGDFVRKGQIVATIINPDVAGIQQQLQTVNAQISLNEIEYNRQKELVAGNAAPLKNVQRVESELTTLKATRNSLQKQLSTMGIPISDVNKGNIITTLTITAPITGTVSNVSAQIGSDVNPSTPIAQIVNNALLHLDLFVFEKDLPKVHDKQTVHFTLTNNPGKEYDAQIFSIGTAFINESKTIPIHAVVKGDKKGLIEGMNITAVISIGTTLVPAVPSDAIVNFQGQDYIFILSKGVSLNHEQKEEGGSRNKGIDKEEPGLNFERVRVIKGVSDVGYTEITLVKNIPLDAKIITKGAFFAMAKMTNAGEDE